MTGTTGPLPLHRSVVRLARRVVLAVTLVVVTGNVAILGLFAGARLTADGAPAGLPGIDHFRVVDERLWRGDAPAPEGYDALAAAGVRTIVDLRPGPPHGTAAGLARRGIRYVHLPVPDGHAPGREVVDRFLAVVHASDGVVYVHCAAGVGRTGALAAAYRTSQGASALQALHENLAVGPPSLEQIAFVLGARGDGQPDRPGPLITIASRLIDGPRRVFTIVSHGL